MFVLAADTASSCEWLRWRLRRGAGSMRTIRCLLRSRRQLNRTKVWAKTMLVSSMARMKKTWRIGATCVGVVARTISDDLSAVFESHDMPMYALHAPRRPNIENPRMIHTTHCVLLLRLLDLRLLGLVQALRCCLGLVRCASVCCRFMKTDTAFGLRSGCSAVATWTGGLRGPRRHAGNSTPGTFP